MSQQNKLLLAGGLIVAALVIFIFAYRRMNALPYPEMSPERVRQERARIKEAERAGPPGGGFRR